MERNFNRTTWRLSTYAVGLLSSIVVVAACASAAREPSESGIEGFVAALSSAEARVVDLDAYGLKAEVEDDPDSSLLGLEPGTFVPVFADGVEQDVGLINEALREFSADDFNIDPSLVVSQAGLEELNPYEEALYESFFASPEFAALASRDAPLKWVDDIRIETPDLESMLIAIDQGAVDFNSPGAVEEFGFRYLPGTDLGTLQRFDEELAPFLPLFVDPQASVSIDVVNERIAATGVTAIDWIEAPGMVAAQLGIPVPDPFEQAVYEIYGESSLFARHPTAPLLALNGLSSSPPQMLQDDSTGTTSSTTTTSLPEGFRRVDAAIDKLILGNVGFSAPRDMDWGDVAEVELLISVEDSVDDLMEVLESNGSQATAEAEENISFSSRMKARLTGHAFEIEPNSELEQVVGSRGRTNWKWQIEPRQWGPQILNLELVALIDVAGERAPHEVETFSREIDVSVDLMDRARHDAEFLIAVGTLVLAGGAVLQLVLQIVVRLRAKLSGKSIFRGTQGRWLAGVAIGLAVSGRWPVGWIRVIFVVSNLFGVIVYVGLWMKLDNEPERTREYSYP